MTAAPQIGVMLTTYDTWDRGIRDPVRAAAEIERLGFDSVWAGDHLHFNMPILEAFGVLSAIAAGTERITFGSAVLLAALRHPAWVAKQTGTVQWLSGNRFVLGLGVGGEKPEEWDGANVPTTERGRRTNIILDSLPDLLAGRPHVLPAPFQTEVPPLEPTVPMPPVWIGGRSEAALQRTIRHGDAWLGAFANLKLFRSVGDRLEELAQEAGRARPELASVLFVHVGDDRDVAESTAREFVDRQYRVDFDAMDRYVVRGPHDEVVDRIREYVDAGLTHFVVMPVDREPERQYEPLALVREAVLGRYEQAVA